MLFCHLVCCHLTRLKLSDDAPVQFSSTLAHALSDSSFSPRILNVVSNRATGQAKALSDHVNGQPLIKHSQQLLLTLDKLGRAPRKYFALRTFLLFFLLLAFSLVCHLFHRHCQSPSNYSTYLVGSG